MKIKEIRITISRVEEREDDIVCVRDANFQWTISGPIYPRFLSFLDDVQHLARQADAGDKGEESL